MQVSKELRFPDMRPRMTVKPEIKKGVWNKVKKGFKKTVSFLTFTREYIIREKEYFMWSETLQAFIYIPFEFWWDAASVPKMLSFIFRAMGVLGLGAIPHDFGYRYAGFLIYYPKEDVLRFEACTRKVADGVLKEISIRESGMPKSVKTATLTLRAVGRTAWKKWRKKNPDVRKDFPDLAIK